MNLHTSRIFTAVLTLGLLTASSSASEKVLHTFTAGKDGALPFGSVISDSAGNLYGAATEGGAFGVGVIFKLTPTASGPWQETILYHFTGVTDGSRPIALALDSAGNLYGIAQAGGRATRGAPQCINSGCGTIFRLSPGGPSGWTFNLLHAFTGVDGAQPQGITLDANGDVFVATSSGPVNSGTVFEMSPSHRGLKGSTLHAFPFTFTGDGSFPSGPVVLDAAGNVYGVAQLGGAFGQGAIYKLAPGSTGQWTESLIYSFPQSGADGQDPIGGMVFDSAGNLYGATYNGGAATGGTVFALAPGSGGTWTESVIYSFTGGSDGAQPNAGPILDAAGNLFGTTIRGGFTNSGLCDLGCGVAYQLTPGSSGWSQSVLYSFLGGSDGLTPSASLIMDAAGNLYSTTPFGGKTSSACSIGCGVVFELPSAASGDEVRSKP